MIKKIEILSLSEIRKFGEKRGWNGDIEEQCTHSLDCEKCGEKLDPIEQRRLIVLDTLECPHCEKDIGAR